MKTRNNLTSFKIFKIILLFFTIFILCSSCEKEELPVPAHVSGNMLTNHVEMGSDYKLQFFFDLETNSVVGENLKTDWDLGFENSTDGFHIILNTSKMMLAGTRLETNFEKITDTIGIKFGWDESSGNLDSTAIGDWRNAKNIFVIDLGFNEEGKHLGFQKIMFENVNETEYNIRFSKLDGTEEVKMEIPKNLIYRFSYLSFNQKKMVEIAPPQENWDLVFTQYTNIFRDETPVSPYLVTGVLSNRNCSCFGQIIF